MNRNEFFGQLTHLNERELKNVSIAYWLAKNGHRGQIRGNKDEVIRRFEHVRGVALLLVTRGFNTASVVIKCLLHDLTEDTHTPEDVIRRLFGIKISKAIAVLSKVEPVFNPSNSAITGWVEKADHVYYAEISHADTEVRLVKCADRLYNLTAMQGVWPKKKQRKYATHTIQYLLPIAYLTDPALALEIDRTAQSILK